MINKALVFIKNTVNQNLKNHFVLDENIAVLNHLVEQDGSVPQKNQNKMVLSLINLEHETNQPYAGRYRHLNSSRIESVSPAVRFNMDLLFTASFDDYEESLKFLNSTIEFFQANSSLNRSSNSDIPDGIDMLNFEVM